MRFPSPLMSVLCMIGMMIHAQTKTTLTIEESVNIAMKNNVQVISSQNAYQTASANVLPKVVGRNLPTLDASASASKTIWNSVGTGAAKTPDSRNAYSYSLDAGYVIFDGLRKFDEMSQARSEESSAKFDLERTRQDVALQVYQAYFNVLKNQQLLRISEENLKRSEEQLKRIEERNKLGAQILSDVYKQRVQVGSDKLSVSRAKNNLNTSKATLSSLIGIDVNSDIELKDVSVDKTLNAQDLQFENAVQLAFEKRQDYRASVNRVESARKGIRIAQSGFFPTVNAFASYSWNNQYFQFKNYSQRDNVSFGINMSVPIFSGFETRTRVIQTDNTYQTSRSNLENTKRKVALDVKIALLNTQTAFDNMKLSEENLNSSKEDLRLATERYNLGAGTILDQITANANFANAEASYIQSMYDFLYARQQFNLAVGTLEIKQ